MHYASIDSISLNGSLASVTLMRAKQKHLKEDAAMKGIEDGRKETKKMCKKRIQKD